MKNQLDLFEWANTRPTADVIDLVDVLVRRIQTGRLQYYKRDVDATVIVLGERGAA